MALDATEVRVGVTGHLYKAIVGSTMPTDTTTALAVAWKELGYTETGPKLSVDTKMESFIPWQSLSPVREALVEQTVTAEFALWQRNADTLKLAWGGGTVTGTTTRVFTPPSVPSVNEGAFVFEITDGTIIDRYLIQRASISLSGDVEFKKDGVTAYTIMLKFLQPATGSPWSLLSSDDNITADV
ncbi:MAG: hypothetical protein ABIP03_11685 [Aquihabitans sp.]